MPFVAHVIARILHSRDLIIKKMIWGGMAILRLDTLFLMVIYSVCDHFFMTCLKTVTICEFLNRVSI